MRYVLDSSALLAFLQQERGKELVEQALSNGAIMSQVNLAEVVTKLREVGMPEDNIYALLTLPKLDLVDFDRVQAYKTGLLRPLTKNLCLSLGDRACLALAQMLGLPVLTTDQIWSSLMLNIAIAVIR